MLDDIRSYIVFTVKFVNGNILFLGQHAQVSQWFLFDIHRFTAFKWFSFNVGNVLRL